MSRGRGASFVLAFLLLSVFPLVPAAEAQGEPMVTDGRHEPRYPIHPSDVTLSVRVEDPDGVDAVIATWCFIPPTACIFPAMGDPDGDGVYEAVVSTSADVQGAYYAFFAQDSYGNWRDTAAAYVLFVDFLEVSLRSSTIEAEPGRTVPVEGTVFCEANSTAPTEGATVAVTIPTTSPVALGRATVDAAGEFSLLLPSPEAEGTYTIEVTATDRTISGSDQASLVVSAVPRPELAIADVRPSTENPTAGQPLAISFRVENLGSADARDVRVVADVVTEGLTDRIFDETVAIPKGGGSVLLVAQWTPRPGVHAVRVYVDPDGIVEEVDETNNLVELAVTVRTPAPTGGSSNLWLVAAIAVAVAAGAMVVLLAVRRRRVT